MRTSRLLSISALLVAVTAVGHADEPRGGKRRPDRRPSAPPAETAKPDPRATKQRPVRTPAVQVDVAAPDDAPTPPTDALKKTQPPEYGKQPGKAEIRAIENLIYTMERPGATIWGWRDDPSGKRARDIDFVAKQLAELDAGMAALASKQPDWKRRDEYAKRTAYLARAHAAQRAHYGAVDTARDQAVAAAEAAAAAEWAAKRTVDDGVVGPLHTAAVGKVVFSTAALTAASKPSQAVTETTATAPLFVRAYVAQSPWNLLHADGVDCGRVEHGDFWIKTMVQVGTSPEQKLEARVIDRAAFQKRTALELTGAASLTAGGTFGNADEPTAPFAWLARVAGELKPGRNTVTLITYAGCPAGQAGVEIARGSLTVTATAASLAELAGRGAFKMSPSVHPAKALTKIDDTLRKRYAADYEVLDLRSAGEWQPRRNDLGIVLARVMPLVVVLRKRANPNACTIMSVEISEPFDGRSYGPALNLDSEFPRPFVCNPR